MNRLDSHESDASLVTEVLAGNREAFAILASRYYASVLRLCLRLLSDSVQAQDIAQEAILQAFLGLNRLQQPARFGAWLHAIAANLARSSLRRLRPISLDGLVSRGSSALREAVASSSPEDVIALRETHNAILAALMELSHVNREAVIGYYIQGYSYAELAGLLDVPVSTVKNRLFKGRQQMRKQLEHLRPTRHTGKEYPMTPELIPLQIEMICEYVLTQSSIVLLRTLTDHRYLPIKLSSEEALALERLLKHQPDALPVMHQDTLLQLVSQLGGQIEKIVIRSLLEQSYYGGLVLAQNDRQSEINCRLSDALLLAVRAQLPVYVAPDLLEEAGIALELVESDPHMAEAELAEPPEPIVTSDWWHETFVEQVWSFLLSTLYKHRQPHDLSRLKSIAWKETFPAREISWEDQAMQAIQLPVSEPAWLVMPPELWAQITDFVEWVQNRAPRPTEPQPIFVPLRADQRAQIEESFEKTWPALSHLGARTIVLMHVSGRLISWRSLDNYESAVRMGRAAVKDLVLTRHLGALVHAAAEPAIRIMYERTTAFNPAQAAGTNVTSSSEAVIHNAWLLAIGWSPEQQEGQETFDELRQNLEMLLTK